MAAKGGGESKAGLVVFLVLFILLSIILGVTTYLGYSDNDKERQAAKTATDSAKGWENDANWYHYVADTYRMYMGFAAPPGDDVAAMRKDYSSGNGAKDKAKAEEHKKVIENLDKTKKWDDQLKKPSETYQDEIAQRVKERDDAVKKNKELDQQLTAANELAESRKRELDAAKLDYAQKLAKRKQDDDNELTALRNDIEALHKKFDAQGELSLAGLKPLKDDNEKYRVEIKRLTKELTGALKTIQDRGLELARTESTAEIDVSKINPDNLARIVSIGGSGDMPYISIGSADNLKRQVTFSIFGKGADGRPLKEPKGRLEVIRITGPHMAQTRITGLVDDRRDPVLVGDFLYNPAWNPNLKQHVAIIGNIDLNGDGHNDLAEFIRTLKNQNVAVDAWMDMKAHKLNGEVTRQTDLLIVGTSPEFGSGVIKADDPTAAGKNKTFKEMQDVQDKAEKLGVRIVRLNAFLEMSGYPLPKAVKSDLDKINFHRNLPAAGSPIERRQPQQPQK